jgi:hypothetical protein
MSDDFYDAFALWPDLDTDAEEGAADEWVVDEIVRRAVERFGETVVLTVTDADGSRSYPLRSLLGNLALRGAWGEKTIAFGRPGEKPVRLGPVRASRPCRPR